MRASLARARHWTSLALGQATPHGDSQRRYTRIVQSALTALAGRGVGFLVSFLSVPLTIHYLGAERYGVWITISTLLLWLSLADFGLGSSLTNAVSEAYGGERPDLARRYVSSAFWMLCSLALTTGAVFAPLWHAVNWVALFNIHTPQAQAEVGPAVAVAVAIYLIGFPLVIVAKILGAYQEGSLANYWAAAGNLASLAGLLLVTRFHGGLVWLVLAFSGAGVLVSGLSAVWLFGRHMPWLRPRLAAVSRADLKTLGGTGSKFFVVQVAALLIFQTDNLVISHYLGAARVVPYNTTYRLFGYVPLLQGLVLAPLWPAYTEAVTRGDWRWIHQTFKRTLALGMSIGVLGAAALFLLGKVIILHWAGPAATPSTRLLVGMACWTVLWVWGTTFGTFLSGVNHINGQTWYALGGAVLNIVLTLLFVRPFGLEGVIAGSVISFLCTNAWPVALETHGVFRSHAKSLGAAS